jgi:hypothetical protein
MSMTSALNSKKYFTFNPRLIIYSSLILTTFIFLYVSSIHFDKYLWWQDFWVNLSAGSVSTLITVTIVDYFINIEKNLKLKAINKPIYFGFLIYLRITMTNIMVDFGYIDKKDKDLTNLDNTEEKFKDFLKDQKTIRSLDDLSDYNVATLKFVNKTLEVFRKFKEHVSKSFHEFVPYSNPTISQNVIDNLILVEGALEAYRILLEGALIIVPKKTKSSQKDQNVFKKEMTVLWRMTAKGHGNDEKSLRTLYLNNFNLILELTEKVKKEQLHFDI